jgi:hypothetical protein
MMMKRRGGTKQNQKRNAERFFNLHFLDQKWSKDLEFALAKLRGLWIVHICQIFAHSHVYGLHRLILCTKTKQENQCNEASRLVPPPPPHHTSSAPSFSGSGAYRHPRYSYTWYTGVSQYNFLWQKYLAFNFWKISPIFFFFCRSAPVHFRNTLRQKMHALLHQSLTRESFSRSFFRYSFFTLP